MTYYRVDLEWRGKGPRIAYVEDFDVTRSINSASGSFTFSLPRTREYAEIFNMTDVKLYEVNGNIETLITAGVIEEKIITPNEIRFTGRDYGYLLQGKQIDYISIDTLKAHEIVKRLLDVYQDNLTYANVINSAETASRWFLRGKTLFEAVQMAARLAKDSSGQFGYDFYVDENKDLNFFPRYSRPSKVVLEKNDLTDYSYKRSAREIYNRILIYGSINQPIPSDGDAWTENDITDWWTIWDQTTSIQQVNDPSIVGIHSVQCTNGPIVEGERAGGVLGSASQPITRDLSNHERIRFWIRSDFLPDNGGGSELNSIDVFFVKTWDTDYKYKYYILNGASNTWHLIDLPLSSFSTYGTCSWSDWKYIIISVKPTDNQNSGSHVWFDGIAVVTGRVAADVKDCTSIARHGLRNLPIMDLTNQASIKATNLANALLDHYKDEHKYVTVTVNRLNFNINPGDVIKCWNGFQLFRMRVKQVKHDFRSFRTIVSLGKEEPDLSDVVASAGYDLRLLWAKGGNIEEIRSEFKLLVDCPTACETSTCQVSCEVAAGQTDCDICACQTGCEKYCETANQVSCETLNCQTCEEGGDVHEY